MARRSLPRSAAIIGLLLTGVIVWLFEADDRSGVDAAFQGRASGRFVTTEGRVQRILPDDLDGSAHQRFIIEIPSGLTLLIAHNIDLAPRIPNLATGDRVAVRGEYEWNERGGIVHWTHHDPAGRQAGGWIEHRGQRYQ